MLQTLPEAAPLLVPETGCEIAFPPLGPNLKVLMVWPRFPPSFWGFEGVLEMIPEAAMTPPLGMITVAALCPPSWTLRLIDHCFEEVLDDDLLWADLVMVSAMHAQRVPGPAPSPRPCCGTPTTSWSARPRRSSPTSPSPLSKGQPSGSTPSSTSRT
jgi:hypothetical protein